MFTYAPTFAYPLSGDVVQDIETSWFARMKGVPEVEYEIITEVWSYGEQLGCLTDVLLEVVEELEVESPAVTKLRDKAKEMEGCYAVAMDRIRQRIEAAEADLKRLEEGRG